MIVVAGVLVAGCAPSAGTSDSGSNSSNGESSDPDAGLSIEFLRWLFPVEAGDYESGAEVYAAPFVRGDDLQIASCLEQDGYRDFAEAIRLDQVPEVGGSGLLLFPRPREWDLVDLGRASEMPATAVFNNVYLGSDPDGEQKRQLTELMASDLAGNPRFGVDPGGAHQLYDSLLSCMTSELQVRPTALDQADLYFSDWLGVLAAIDEQPEVVESLDSASECLEGIAPDFADQNGPFGWLTLWDSFASSTPRDDSARWTVLSEWLDAYYECMVPVIEARRPLRLEERESIVDERLTQLLELQSDLDSALQDLDG